MDVFDEWQAWFLLVGGLVALTLGTLIRAGRARAWVNVYWTARSSRFAAASPFTLIPGGATFLLWLVGIVVGRDVSAVAGTLIFATSLIPLGLFFYISLRLPPWSKPAWVREREAKLAEGGYVVYRGETRVPADPG